MMDSSLLAIPVRRILGGVDQVRKVGAQPVLEIMVNGSVADAGI